MKALFSSILFTVLVFSFTQAQVSEISAKLNETQDKFIITYKLEKGKTGFWNVQLIAFIDGVQIDPSRSALFGDVGQQIRYGKNKRIVWDAYIDVESIDGEVRFEISAKLPPMAAPPTPKMDYISGGVLAAGGVGLLASNLPNALKKGNIDVNATPSSDPISYYYTFCDPSSTAFDAEQVIVEQAGLNSLCDQHLETANSKYKSATTGVGIGGALIVIGGILILTKPIHKYIQMPKYLKANGLSFEPTVDFNSYYAGQTPQVNVGLSLTYTLGRK